MNDLATIMNYEQLKSELNEELSRTANSFVRIGYLLKLARDDRHILDGSGYSDVNEFASKEYGLDKTQVSRFIRINDRFSIDGNSTQLLPEYAEYGSAKLSLMLTLPDEINAELSPDMSKSDIQAIKEDYDEEQKISPIEVACEDKDPEAPDEFLEAVVKQLNDEHPDPINYYHETGNQGCFNEIKAAYIPYGDKTYNIRIAGQGRFMVNMKESDITIINMRDPSIKTPVTWEEFRELVLKDEATRDFTKKNPEPEKKEKPKKVEKSKPKKNAPVQPQKEEIMTKPVEPEEAQQGQQAEEQTETQEEEREEKQPEAAGAKYEDTDVLDKIQVDLIDELDILKTYIERRNWKSAKETAEDVVNRIKHLGY